jgi:hypothetical protein
MAARISTLPIPQVEQTQRHAGRSGGNNSNGEEKDCVHDLSKKRPHVQAGTETP